VQPTGGNSDAFLLGQLSTSSGGSVSSEELQHGTSMYQQLIQAIAMVESQKGTSNVRVLPVDVYGNRGMTTSYDVAYGIYLAINNGAMVINLSLGSSGDSEFLHRMIQEGSKQGVVFFAAAGNEPIAAPTYPAAYPEVVAVTAGDRSGNLASYANYGTFVDVIAPGSTLVNFGQKTYVVGGTSVASAYASGMAAGGIDISKKSPAEVAEAIRRSFAFQPAKN
jgi:hypothetical protein